MSGGGLLAGLVGNSSGGVGFLVPAGAGRLGLYGRFGLFLNGFLPGVTAGFVGRVTRIGGVKLGSMLTGSVGVGTLVGGNSVLGLDFFGLI